MRTRKLGDLEVAVVGMGTAYTFHNVPSPKDMGVRQQIIDSCIASDISFIDTSPMYGDSEKVLGIVTEGKRQRFQLATKVWTRGQGKGREQIARSFRLLGTDYHRGVPDSQPGGLERPSAGAWKTSKRRVKSGK